MYYVYQLQSVVNPLQKYTGYTENIEMRLKEHNSGRVPHTTRHKPWKVKNFLAFSNEEKARRFERYLKTGSGRAFCKKTFLRAKQTHLKHQTSST
ncbi:MAG: GIY-YIG nuclease family protein [Candidatus Tantalella remota]|nr:GIY-YIG nuclease family protein [Candidatus Tantalella remota]